MMIRDEYTSVVMFRTVGEIVDERLPIIDRWLASGPGRIFQFDLVCGSDFGLQVVKELCARGYAANGKQATFTCMCDEHDCDGRGGTEIELGVYEVRVARHV